VICERGATPNRGTKPIQVHCQHCEQHLFRNAHTCRCSECAGRDDPWLQSRNSLTDCWIGQFSLSAVMLISATMRSQAGFSRGKLNGIIFPYSSIGIHFVALFLNRLGTKNSMTFAINHPTFKNRSEAKKFSLLTNIYTGLRRFNCSHWTPEYYVPPSHSSYARLRIRLLPENRGSTITIPPCLGILRYRSYWIPPANKRLKQLI
jgi:hypothetical protein